MRGLGSDNVDCRLRQTDFRDDGARDGIPYLGMPIAAVGALDRALVVGSFLRKDQPLLAHRLRQAAKKGAQISSLHSVDDDWLMPIAHRAIVTPSQLPAMLAQIVVAAAQGAGKDVPAALQGLETAAAADVIAASLLSGERRAILLGNYAIQHRDASQIVALAQALASITGATLGVCTEAANTVGGYVAGAVPQKDGLNAQAMLGTEGTESRRAYVLLHAEPEFDCANPVAARAALEKADLVVVLSEFRTATRYADVLLPIAPFTETSGTFVNCEGRAQRFHGVVQPAGQARRPRREAVEQIVGELGAEQDFAHPHEQGQGGERPARCGAPHRERHRIACGTRREKLHADPRDAREREADPHAAGKKREERGDQQCGDEDFIHCEAPPRFPAPHACR